MRFGNTKKKGTKFVFILLTIALSVGLVGSFAIWSLPSSPKPQASKNDSQQSSGANYDYLNQSIKDYETQLESDPENVDLLTKLGNAYYDLGIGIIMDGQDVQPAMDDLKKALSSYEKVLELKPGDLDLELQAGTTAFYTGDDKVAESHFQNALKIDPNSVSAKMSYGQFLMYGKSDYEGAKAQWQSAIEQGPDDATKQQLQSLIAQADQMEQQAKSGDNGSSSSSSDNGSSSSSSDSSGK